MKTAQEKTKRTYKTAKLEPQSGYISLTGLSVPFNSADPVWNDFLDLNGSDLLEGESQ
jgi:hypothetical protein